MGDIFTRCVCVCPILCHPGSSLHVILQARILDLVISSSRESSQPRDWTPISWVSSIAGRFSTTVPPGKPILPGEVMWKWGFGYHSLISVQQSRQNSRYERREEAKDDSTFSLIRPRDDICYLLCFKVIVQEIFDHIDLPVKLKSVKRQSFYRWEWEDRERWRTRREE